MTISKETAVKMIQEHGMEPNANTFVWKGDHLVPRANFFEALGDHDEYGLDEVLSWLAVELK